MARLGFSGPEGMFGRRLLVAEGAAFGGRWAAYVRERLPMSEWPQREREELRELLARRGNAPHSFDRRQWSLELCSPSDQSAGMSLGLVDEPPGQDQLALWALPTAISPGGTSTLFFGVAGAAVDRVRWTPASGQSYLCATVQMLRDQRPAGAAKRGQHGLEQCGQVEALDADGRMLGHVGFSGTFVGQREPPELAGRQMRLPVIARGSLPDGRRWLLR